MACVVVRNLWKKYKNNVIALRGVNFTVKEERLIILAGPNGSGKTTLIRIMDGELSPTRGYVKIEGLSPDEARLKGLFGVMPQEARLYEYLSVREYLYYLALIKGLSRSDARREVNRIIDDFMLSEYADTRIEYLSGGFKRRVLLAQAFIGSPPLVFLDEPTVGLDPEMRVKLWDIIIKYLRENNATAFLVTHYLDEVKEYADRVLVLFRGKLIFDGSPRKLLDVLGYKYRVLVKVTDRCVKVLFSSFNFNDRGNELELYVKNEVELLGVLKIARENEDKVMEVTIKRPSLEESYLRVIGVGKSS